MPHISPLELAHCKELAMSPGSLFEFTSRYIPTARQQQLLALYALTQSVGSIPAAATDDSVKWAKLKWWSEELLADPASPSRHPVLRALWQSGARKKMDNGLLLQLVSNAVMQMDEAPDAHENAMFTRLAANGTTEILLELVLDEAEIETKELNKLAAASALYAMISLYSADRQYGNLRLPLDLLAKHQLTPTQVAENPPGAELVAVVSHLASSGSEWFSQGLSGLDASEGMHLQLRWAMEARLLARFSKGAGTNFQKGHRFGPTDAWFAWRYCRMLARS